MERNLKELVAQMTLEEKAGMCSGLDFWHQRSRTSWYSERYGK